MMPEAKDGSIFSKSIMVSKEKIFWFRQENSIFLNAKKGNKFFLKMPVTFLSFSSGNYLKESKLDIFINIKMLKNEY